MSRLPSRTQQKHERLIGTRSGRLTITTVEHRRQPSGAAAWYAICDCDCGTTGHAVAMHNLATVSSCGCYRRSSIAQRNGGLGLVPGMRSDRLVAVALLPFSGPSTYRNWLCLCDCGTHTRVREQNFLSGTTRSCGCLRRELAATRTRTHGMYRHPLYRLWQAIKDRCSRVESYRRLGIIMYREWVADFSIFSAYIWEHLGHKPSKQHSLDRIDPHKGYEPGNIRWALPDVQTRNRTNNHWIEVNGERLVLADWARRLGVRPQAIVNRIRLGWTEQEAVTTPTRKPR